MPYRRRGIVNAKVCQAADWSSDVGERAGDGPPGGEAFATYRAVLGRSETTRVDRAVDGEEALCVVLGFATPSPTFPLLC